MGSNESPLSIGMLIANAHVLDKWEEKNRFLTLVSLRYYLLVDISIRAREERSRETD